MKRFLIFLAVLFASITLHAQWIDWIEMPKHVWGLRVGGRVSDMALTYDGFSKYEHSPIIAPTAGLYARHRLVGGLSLRTDLVYAKRGVDLLWCDVHYSMDVPTLDLRPMVQFNIGNPWWAAIPYINVGVECNLVLPLGKVQYQSGETAPVITDLNRGNIKPLDFSFWAGLGCDFHLKPFYKDVILAFEIGGDLGLLNNFTRTEQNGQAQVLNTDMADGTNIGQRRNRGIEATVALCIPIVKKKKIPKLYDYDELEAQLEQYKEPPRPPAAIDTTASRDSLPARKHPGIEYEYKECYTLDEILALVARGEDVCDLRICLFDINFAFDSYELTMGSMGRLDRVIKLLQDHPELSLRVNGHTDSIGSDEYNDRLSLSRASEVAGYFMRKGIREARVTYAGFGERYPIDSNATEEGRHRNRRVELELYCDEYYEAPTIKQTEDDEDEYEYYIRKNKSKRHKN